MYSALLPSAPCIALPSTCSPISSQMPPGSPEWSTQEVSPASGTGVCLYTCSQSSHWLEPESPGTPESPRRRHAKGPPSSSAHCWL